MTARVRVELVVFELSANLHKKNDNTLRVLPFCVIF